VPEFRRLFLLAQIGKFTPEEKEEYEKSLNSMSDFYNIIGSAERLARQEGLREGRAEGREEARLEAAKSLKENGVSVDVIAKSLTLPIELIEEL
jgi:predicted transposase/invertase (TIGR01784 family)